MGEADSISLDVMTEPDNIKLTLSRAYCNCMPMQYLILLRKVCSSLVTAVADSGVFKLCCSVVAKVELCVSREA